LLAGNACGIPYAPDLELYALGFQPLSLFQSATKQLKSVVDQPYALHLALA